MKWITFTEEFIVNQDYYPECSGWIAGRMEVYDTETRGGYAEYEKRFFTPHRQQFLKWRWVWEGQHVTDLILKQIERKLEEFNQGPPEVEK